jgi:hypothetical protein
MSRTGVDKVMRAIETEWRKGERNKRRLIDAGIHASLSLNLPLERVKNLCENTYETLTTKAEPFREGGLTIHGEPATYSKDEYVYGLYRRGAVSICHGPSGVGKTRLLLEYESAAREGREFLGYRGPAVNPLLILRDRPMDDYYETLDSMGLPHDFVQMVELPMELMDGAAAQKIADIIEQFGRPQLVAIEGLDQTMGSILKRTSLIPQLKFLQALAKHTGSAILGTWGAPKRQSNPREMYLNSRDAAAGGSDLARLSSTMVGIGQEFEARKPGKMERGKTGRLIVNMDFRSRRPRQVILKFDESTGRLVECPQIEVRIDHVEDSYEQAREKAAEILAMSKPTFYRRRKKALQ